MSEMGLAGHHESYDGGDVYGAAGYAPQPGYGVSGGQPVPGAFHASAMHSITETSELLGHPLTKYTRNLYANLAEASRFHLAQTATKARKSRAKGAAAPTAEADASALHLASAPPAQQPPHSTDNSSPISVESEDEELAVGRQTRKVARPTTRKSRVNLAATMGRTTSARTLTTASRGYTKWS